MRTTKSITVKLPAGIAEIAERLAKTEKRTMSELVTEAIREYDALRRQMAEDEAEWAKRVDEILEDAKRNPMTPKQAAAADRELMKVGATAAKRLGIKERDIVDIIHRSRARRRAAAGRPR